jgi:hypothetical protein
MKVSIRDEGTVIMVTPMDEDATAWIDERCETEPWQWSGPALVVDRRAALTIVDGFLGDGGSVEALPHLDPWRRS